MRWLSRFIFSAVVAFNAIFSALCMVSARALSGRPEHDLLLALSLQAAALSILFWQCHYRRLFGSDQGDNDGR